MTAAVCAPTDSVIDHSDIAGPAGPVGGGVSHSYFIWNFAGQTELAKQFLVDLVSDYREALVRSEFYNLPAFPGAVQDIEGVLAADAIIPKMFAAAARGDMSAEAAGREAQAPVQQIFDKWRQQGKI